MTNKDLIPPEIAVQVSTQIDPFLRRDQVLRVTGLSASTLQRQIQHSDFPTPYKITETLNGWKQSEVVAWMADRPKAPV